MLAIAHPFQSCKAQNTYVKSRLPPEELRLLNTHNRHLKHHRQKAVAAEFLGNTTHYQFMCNGTDQEGDEHGDGLREARPCRVVDMATEKVVHGDVPFAGEFEPVGFPFVRDVMELSGEEGSSPVTRIPPVRVKVTISETGDFRKSTQEVLKDDQENKQEGNHERE